MDQTNRTTQRATNDYQLRHNVPLHQWRHQLTKSTSPMTRHWEHWPKPSFPSPDSQRQHKKRMYSQDSSSHLWASTKCRRKDTQQFFIWEKKKSRSTKRALSQSPWRNHQFSIDANSTVRNCGQFQQGTKSTKEKRQATYTAYLQSPSRLNISTLRQDSQSRRHGSMQSRQATMSHGQDSRRLMFGNTSPTQMKRKRDTWKNKDREWDRHESGMTQLRKRQTTRNHPQRKCEMYL